ncbi:MAG: hypothetical protein ACLUGY_21410 [Phocaeicola massiliensis]
MSNSDLYHPLLEGLGMYLPYNHIINQVIYFEGNDKLRAKIARNIDIYGSNSSMSKSIKVQFDKLDKLQEEILEENETLVRTFFSICIFDESQAVLKGRKISKGNVEHQPVQILYSRIRESGAGTLLLCSRTDKLHAGGIPDTHHASHCNLPFPAVQRIQK